MAVYVKKALFIYTEEGSEFVEQIQKNPFNASVAAISFAEFTEKPETHLKGFSHVVISGTLDAIKEVFRLAVKHQFSVGILPLVSQKNLIHCYDLPKKTEDAIELALQNEPQKTDLIYCNDEIMLFKATIGRTPLLDSPVNAGLFAILYQALKKLRGLRLLGFNFTTSSNRKIQTAASGCMLVQHHEGTLASKLISHDSSLTDGMISLVVTAPFSIIDYLKLLSFVFTRGFRGNRIEGSTGLIKSSELKIESEIELDVFIDDERSTFTPLSCHVMPAAVKINMGSKISLDTALSSPAKERINIDNLPSGKEIAKATNGVLPFFSYASEERFKDLFTALNDDANINSIYVVLMLLSTVLATIGLYLDSSSVIIGAMLLAPLMAPIVSLAMGLLRQNTYLLKNSIIKIVIGVVLALLAASFTSVILPYDPVTGEMQARLNPSLLDLGVAIVAGIAGAYTKSYKEILQSLAGVAIAVALVPPLAVAGIGLGRWDFDFFFQAFLLFSTNLIGIIIAASITFRVLGYAAAVRDKKGFIFVVIILILIMIPLYLSYEQIIDKYNFENAWENERFLVNDKYLIIKNANLFHLNEKKVLQIDILAREKLDRDDLSLLKCKIERNVSEKLIIRANIIYIL